MKKIIVLLAFLLPALAAIAQRTEVRLARLEQAPSTGLIIISDSDSLATWSDTLRLVDGYLVTSAGDTMATRAWVRDSTVSLIDSTRLLQDSILVYYQDGIEIGRDTLSLATPETDPIYAAAPAASILSGDITNWNNSFGWGDHALAGYLTSYTETQTLQDVTDNGNSTTNSIAIGTASPPSYVLDVRDNGVPIIQADSSQIRLNTLNTGYDQPPLIITEAGNGVRLDFGSGVYFDSRNLNNTVLTTFDGGGLQIRGTGLTGSLTLRPKEVRTQWTNISETEASRRLNYYGYFSHSWHTNDNRVGESSLMYLDDNDLVVFPDFSLRDTSNATYFFGDKELARVGIGITTPSYKMDVNGTGRFTGKLTLEDITEDNTNTDLLALDPVSGEVEERTVQSLNESTDKTLAVTDTDLSISTQFTNSPELRTIHILAHCTGGGASDDVTLTLPTPSVTHVGKKVYVKAYDGNGTYDVIIDRVSGAIYVGAASGVNTVTAADGDTITLICLLDGSTSTYGWYVW